MFLLILSGSLFTGISRPQQPAAAEPGDSSGTPKYKDASLPIPDRVAGRLARMTLEAKVDQLRWDWQQKVDVIDPTDGSDVRGFGFIRIGQPGKFQFEIDQLEIT